MSLTDCSLLLTNEHITLCGHTGRNRTPAGPDIQTVEEAGYGCQKARPKISSPQSMLWAGQAAGQVLPDLLVLGCIEALPFVVGNRQKDFNEVHGRPPVPWTGMSPSSGAAPLAGCCAPRRGVTYPLSGRATAGRRRAHNAANRLPSGGETESCRPRRARARKPPGNAVCRDASRCQHLPRIR